MNHNATINLPTATVARIATAIASIQGVKFIGVTYRAKETGELARHTLIIGADYKELTRKSMEDITRMLPTLTGLSLQAANDLLVSYSKTLLAQDTNTEHPDYTQAGIWESLCPGLRAEVLARDEAGKPSVWGDKIQITGLSHAKRVLEAGTYKSVNSKPLTLARKAIEKQLPRSKYRTLSVEGGTLESVRVGGNEIEVA